MIVSSRVVVFGVLTLFWTQKSFCDLDDMDPVVPQKSTSNPDSISKSLSVPEAKGENPSETRNQGDPKGVSKNSKKSGNADSGKVKQIKTTPTSSSESEPITWKSKGLRAAKDRGTLELNQDVQVVQGDLELTSNHAKIFRDEVLKQVSKVVVTGNVKIVKSSLDPLEKVVGTGNEAIFLNSERKVTLKGNAKLVRGPDILRGKQITYELDSGWISVDNVEGVMQPNEKDKVKK